MPPADPAPESAAHPLVIGVLGGIASGKSLAARALAGERGRVVDADALAREVLASPEIARRVAQTFGTQVLDADGRPDRTALARIVFGDPERRRTLEGWIHPRVRDRIRADLERARADGVPRLVLDVPLLLENDAQHGLAALCDRLVFVESDAAERDRRAVAGRGWEPGEVARREAHQLPLAEKRARADHVLTNRGSAADLEAAAARLGAELDRSPPS